MNDISITKAFSAKPESNPVQPKEGKSSFKDEMDRATTNGQSEDVKSPKENTSKDKQADETKGGESNVKDNNGENETSQTADHNQDKTPPKKINQKDEVNTDIISVIADTQDTANIVSNPVADVKHAQIAKNNTGLVQGSVINQKLVNPQTKTSDKPTAINQNIVASDAPEMDLPEGQKVKMDNSIDVNTTTKEKITLDLSTSKRPETILLQTTKTSSENIDLSTQQTKTETSITERSHILSKKWSQNIAAKIAVNTANGVQNIKANINPASMGPIEIQISKSDDVMNISMLVTSSATKELLDSNHNKILQSMKDAGMDVSGFDINQQDQQQGQSNETNENKGTDIKSYSDSEINEDDLILDDSINLIDSYA